MKEQELKPKIRHTLEELLKQAGVSLVGEPNQPSKKIDTGNSRTDLELTVRTPSVGDYRLVVEIKDRLLPQNARLVSLQLRNFLRNRPDHQYGILAAPFISPEVAAISREAGLGSVDLAGNCLLQFGGLYIEVSGRLNPFKENRLLKSVFSRVSSRALRRLFLEPKRTWSLSALAQEANVSLGQTFTLKNALLLQEFLQELRQEGKRATYQLRNPRSLLTRWSEAYSYKKNRISTFYVMAEPAEIENQLADICRQYDLRYAFTLTSGAIRVAPYLPYSRVFAYVDGSVQVLQEALGWKEVDSGGNLAILEPYDEGILFGLQQVNGTTVVSDLQLYLDLHGFPQRGEEAADWILQTRLEPSW